MADTIIGAEVSRGGFFNAVRNPSTGKPDITYTADEMREPYKGLITDGVFSGKYVNGQGFETSNPTNFKVLAGGGLSVIVTAGRGIFDGHWFRTLEDATVEVESESTLDSRLDNIIVSVNNNTRTIKLLYRKGGASQPSLSNTGGIVEYRLARIRVWKNAQVINDKDVTDLRGYNHPEGTPWVTTVVKDQLSTEQLFTKWNDLYQKYYDQMTENVQIWAQQVEQSQNYQALTAYQVIRKITGTTSSVTLTASTDYPPMTSGMYYIPLVTVNGYLLTRKASSAVSSPGDYYMDTSTSGQLTFIFRNALTSGTSVTIQLLKAVSTADVPSVTSQLNALVDRFESYIEDQGWQTISPSANATVDTNESDAQIQIRKIGGMVFLRGAVKINPVQGNVICTIPGTVGTYANIRPQKNHIFASNSKKGDNKSPDRASIVVKIDGSVEFWTTTRLASETQDTNQTWHLNTCWPVPYVAPV